MRRSFYLVLSMLLASACFCGCHHPARQSLPEVNHVEREAEWRRELVPGRKADWALAYLLDAGFDCRMVRNEQAQIERITATLPSAVRDVSGEKRNWRIEIAIHEDVIQATEIRPILPAP